MSCQPFADFFGIRVLEFNYSWWHPRQTYDAVASECCSFSKKNMIIKIFFLCYNEPIGAYILGCSYMHVVQKTMNRQLDGCTGHTHTHTHTGQLP